MSNHKEPQVGLENKDFDSSICYQPVDFAVCEKAPEVTAPEMTDAQKSQYDVELRTESSQSPVNPPPILSAEFTSALLASLASVDELTHDGNNLRSHEDDLGNTTQHEIRGESNSRPRIRLFDISDTSSDEDEESQPHMTMNNSRRRDRDTKSNDSIDEDNYLTEDSNLSDITDVTPISSVACSPMPSPCGFETYDDDDGEWLNYDDDENEKILRDAANARVHMDLQACTQQLGPLHLDMYDVGPSSIPSSCLLLEAEPNNAAIRNGDHDETATVRFSTESFNNQPLLGIAKPKQMLLKENDEQQIPTMLLPSSVSSSSSETGSGSGYLGSSSSMSIPSVSTTSAAHSLTNSVYTSSSQSKIFGHSRNGSYKSRAKNCSFTKDEVRRIDRENQILLKKIIDTQKRRQNHGFHGVGGTSSSHHLRVKPQTTLNSRIKQQKRIDYENAILVQKLQATKPSREIQCAFPTNSTKHSATDNRGLHH